MKTKSIFKIFVSLCLFVSLWACNDDDRDFSGKDNYILSFSLSKGDAIYEGAIEGEYLVFTVPSGIILDEATPKIAVSENATISPDPATIKEWSDGLPLTVTSYNKQERIYTLKINQSEMVVEGDFVLNTQKDVNEFVKKGITRLSGNLTVGQAIEVEEVDKITNIEGLKSLIDIERTLTINQSLAINNLHGLLNLQRVGSIIIENENLEDISLPNLKRVDMGMSFSTEKIQQINLEALTHVGERIELSAPEITELNLTSLENCGDELRIGDGQLSEILLPKLKKVGATLYIRVHSALKINLENLESTGGQINISANELTELDLRTLISTSYINISSENLTEISLPKLNKIGGLYLSNLQKLTKISAPEVVTLEEVNFVNIGLENVELKKLTRIGNLQVYSSSFKDFDGFESVTSSNYIYVTNCKNLISYKGLKNVIPALSSSSWTMQGNAYNPTYQDMVDGLYEQQ